MSYDESVGELEVGALPENVVRIDGRPVATALNDVGVACDRPVLVIVGWADDYPEDKVGDQVNLLMREVVIPTSRRAGAVIVTGGTASGIMSVVGKAAAEDAVSPDRSPEDGMVMLLGVAPANMLIGVDATPPLIAAAKPEPHHRILASDGNEWGDEAHTLIRVAECIAGDRDVTVVAVGGTKGTVAEIVMASRRKWSVILLETGEDGTTDRLIALLESPEPAEIPAAHSDETSPSSGAVGDNSGGSQDINASEPRSGPGPAGPSADTDSAPEPSSGTLADAIDSHLALLEASFAADRIRHLRLDERDRLARVLAWKLSDEALLKEGWHRFARLDERASRDRRPAYFWVGVLLALAVVTVVTGLASAFTRPPGQTQQSGQPVEPSALHILIRVAVTALPLIAGVVVALIERRTRRGSWVDLRGASESIKRELYLYRGRADAYAGAGPNPRKRLASALSAINEKVGDPTIGPFLTAWPPDFTPDEVAVRDTLCGDLGPAEYDARATHQIDYLRKSASARQRSALRRALLIWFFAAGAALAVSLSWRWEVQGIAVAVVLASVTAALVVWREYLQLDEEIESKDLTAAQLQIARDRWLSLSPKKRRSKSALRGFVADVENALTTENAEWTVRLRQTHRTFMQARKQ